MSEKGHELVRQSATMGATVTLGAAIGALFVGFGHLRHIYSRNPKRKAKEIAKLEKENVEKLKSRLVIGAVLGAAAGTVLGVVLMPGSSPSEAEDADPQAEE